MGKSKGSIAALRVGGTAAVSTAAWLLCAWLFDPIPPQRFAVPIGLLGLFGGWIAGRIGARLGEKR